MKGYIKIIAFASLSLFAATACVKEELEDGSDYVGDLLSFSATTSVGWNNNGSSSSSSSDTKSASYIGDMELSDGEGHTISVTMSVLDGIESSEEDSSAETKGAMVTSTSIKDYNISVTGYLANTVSAYMDDQIKHSTDAHNSTGTGSGHWAPINDHTYYWPKAVGLDFWAFAPSADVIAAREQTAENKVKISAYRVNNTDEEVEDASLDKIAPKTLKFAYNLGVATDAVDQPDLLFTSALGLAKDCDDLVNGGCVPLNLKHALSAVQFLVFSSKDDTVNSIKLVDVAQKGTCTFAGTTSAFTWTRTADKATYGHDFATPLYANTASDFYSESSTHKDATFMMIPQALGTQKIEISFSADANSAPVIYTGTIPSAEIKAWEAGKTYIYTINIIDNTKVTITDAVSSSNVKSNVVIANTGNTKAYLRATIFGNWVDGNGKILSRNWTGEGTWKVMPHGSSTAVDVSGNYFDFQTETGDYATANAAIGTGWIRGADGFFYYIYQVPAATSAVGTATVGELFHTFTAPTPPVAGAHLEMSIVVQAIQANYLLNPDGSLKSNAYSVYHWYTTGLTTVIDSDQNDFIPAT